jgi:hypothetical protein
VGLRGPVAGRDGLVEEALLDALLLAHRLDEHLRLRAQDLRLLDHALLGAESEPHALQRVGELVGATTRERAERHRRRRGRHRALLVGLAGEGRERVLVVVELALDRLELLRRPLRPPACELGGGLRLGPLVLGTLEVIPGRTQLLLELPDAGGSLSEALLSALELGVEIRGPLAGCLELDLGLTDRRAGQRQRQRDHQDGDESATRASGHRAPPRGRGRGSGSGVDAPAGEPAGVGAPVVATGDRPG